MAKLTQAEIKAKADEWAAYDAKITKAEQAKNEALDPFIVRFNEDTKAIHAKHGPKIQQLRDAKALIEAEVMDWLSTQGKPITLAGEKAVATVEVKVGSRVIDVEKFFAAVKEKNTAFWACVSVVIAKAEKLIGAAKVDEISTKKTGLVPSLKLK